MKDYTVVETMILGKIKRAMSIINSRDIVYVEYGVFGSVARGDYTAVSDVDIVMLVESMPSRYDLAELRCDLEEIGCDFVILYKRNFDVPETVFQKEVKRDYRRLRVYGE